MFTAEHTDERGGPADGPARSATGTVTAGPPLNAANRFAHIDALRAFAVLVVVVSHAGLGHVVPGGSGVTIFFAISGFIITYLLLRERDRTGTFSARSFYFRRAVKIGPPFVLVVAVPTLVYSVFRPVDWSGFLAQVFFVYNWFKDDLEVMPGTGVVWSLAIEEQFYIAFALIWLALVRAPRWRTGLAVLAVVAIVWSTLARFWFAADPLMTDRIYFGTDTRLDGIAWGCLGALGYHLWSQRQDLLPSLTRALSSDAALAAALVLYVASLAVRDPWFRDTLRYSLQSVAATAVILYGLLPGQGPVRGWFVRVVTWRPVQAVGLASYSIYLVHLMLAEALRGLVGGLPLLAGVAALTAAGVVAGLVLYRAVEVPARDWRDRLAARPRRSAGRGRSAGQGPIPRQPSVSAQSSV